MPSLLDPALTESSSLLSQDPNADTEWNDILRKKGILPPKESLKELEKEEAEKEEQRLLQQSVGELAHFSLCSVAGWLWEQATNRCSRRDLRGNSQEAVLEPWHQPCQ